MWGFLLKGLFWMLISFLFRPKDDGYDPPQPGEFQLTNVQEGEVFSRVWGTVYQKRIHILWHGDKRTVAKKSTQGKK